MILVEDIEGVKKQFPKISEEDFNRLIRLDPTFNEDSNNVGDYGKWILNLFNKGKLTNEEHVYDLLSRFNDNKNRLKNKDINSFKTMEEVEDYLNVDSNYNETSKRQELRKKQKEVRGTSIEDDLVYEDNDWKVYIPHNYEASCKLGQGSRWCTATTESRHYYNEYTNQGPLYININKHNPEEKYQFHFETDSYMDKNDHSINLSTFLDNNKGLLDFYTPIMILGDFSRPYNGEWEKETVIKALTDSIKEDKPKHQIGHQVISLWKYNYKDDEEIIKLINKAIAKNGATEETINDIFRYEFPLEDEIRKILIEKQIRKIDTLIEEIEEYGDISYYSDYLDFFEPVADELLTLFNLNMKLPEFSRILLDAIKKILSYYDTIDFGIFVLLGLSNTMYSISFDDETQKEIVRLTLSKQKDFKEVLSPSTIAKYLAKGDTDFDEDTLESFLQGDLSSIYDFYSYSVDRDIAVNYGEDSIDESNWEELNNFGITKDNYNELLDYSNEDETIEEIIDAIALAYDEGQGAGSESECMSSFWNSFTDAIPNGVTLDTLDNEEYTLSVNLEEFIQSAYKDVFKVISDGSIEEVETFDELILLITGTNFKFNEPYYGWDDFSEEAFNDRLQDELYTIKHRE